MSSGLRMTAARQGERSGGWLRRLAGRNQGVAGGGGWLGGLARLLVEVARQAGREGWSGEGEQRTADGGDFLGGAGRRLPGATVCSGSWGCRQGRLAAEGQPGS